MYSVVLSTYKVFAKLDQELNNYTEAFLYHNGGGQKLFAFPRKLPLMQAL